MRDNSRTPISARLDHIQLGTPDPPKLAEFYERVLGMKAKQDRDRMLCRGAERTVILAPGSKKELQLAAYRVRDAEVLEGLARRLANHEVETETSSSTSLAESALCVRDPDGNRLLFGLAAERLSSVGDKAARLQHVVVGTQDVQRMLEFYQTVLGFTLSDRILDLTGGLRSVFLRSDSEHHSIAIFQTSEARLDHHCYELNDWNGIRDWGDHLASHGVHVVWGPGRHGPGNNLFLFFHDPDGNWLELSAELERVGPERPVVDWPHEELTLNRWGQGRLRS